MNLPFLLKYVKAFFNIAFLSTFLQIEKMTTSPVALVQGANRGLGLAFVRILAGRTSKVVATCRNPDQAEELQKVPNVEILKVFQKF